MNHVMLDLETMSTKPNAAIVSIGAVPFDSTGKIAAPVSCFYHTIDLKSCQDAGLHIDAGTVEWWMTQSQKVRDAIFLDCEPLNVVLDHFIKFIGGIKDKTKEFPLVWGNGCGFDNVILREAYLAIGKQIPWRYHDDRDMRTLTMLHQMRGHSVLSMRADKISTSRIEHYALHDAIYQAAQAAEMLKAIRVVKKAPK